MRKSLKFILLFVLFVLVAAVAVAYYAQLHVVLYWMATGADVRANMTACPAPRRSTALPPNGSVEIFASALPVRRRDETVVYYPGYKMCNAVVVPAADGRRRHIVAFAEARSAKVGGYSSKEELPDPPIPGGCDDRTHHAVVFRVSADDGQTWSPARLVAPDDEHSYSDPTAGVHQARDVLVLLFVEGHRRYVTTELPLSALNDTATAADAKFTADVEDITRSVHPAFVPAVVPKPGVVDHADGMCPAHKRNGACSTDNPQWKAWHARCPITCGKMLATETYCNTGHTTTVYDHKAEELLFPASLGGEQKGAFLIVLGADGWSLRGEALLESTKHHKQMEPAIAVDPGTGLLVANCRDFQSLDLVSFFAGNRRVEFYSEDMGRTWQRNSSGGLLAHRTNLAESWLTSGSTGGVAADGTAMYYVGVTSMWTRRGLGLFRKRQDGRYDKVRTLDSGPTMTQNLLVDNGQLLGVVYEQGEPGRPLLGVVFQAARVVYAPLNN